MISRFFRSGIYNQGVVSDSLKEWWAVASMKARDQKLLLGIMGVVIAGLIVLICFQSKIGVFVINQSSSLPQKYFWVSFSAKDLKKGDAVAFRLKRNGFSGMRIVKIVGGVAGDQIGVKNERIFINDRLIGDLHKVTSYGKSLVPIESGVIPKGKIFVYTTHPRSFDSRYQTMGLIDQREIMGRAYALQWF